MKKVFISQDMRKKTTEEILEVRNKVKEAFKKEYNEETFEFIESFKTELKAQHPLKSLSESLAMMCEADIVLSPRQRIADFLFSNSTYSAYDEKNFKGVEAETFLANSYGKNVAFYDINDKGEVYFVYSIYTTILGMKSKGK